MKNISSGLVPLVVFMGLVAVMGGCASWSGVIHPEVPNNAPSVYVLPDVEETPEEAAASKAPPKPNPEDLLEPGDIIDVVVRRGAGEEKYQTVIRANGNVTVSFQDINIKGLTEGEAEEKINRELSRVIKNPSTQLRLTQKSMGRAKNVYLIGEVKIPGRLPLTRGMTLVQAVATAGGYTDIALTEKVVLISKREGRKPLIRIVNMKAALISIDQAPDVALSDNDILFVPRSEAGDFNAYYTKVAQPIITQVVNTLNAVFIGKTLDAAFRTNIDQPAQAAIPVCWVAGALYGDRAWQTQVLRWYITGPLSEHRAGRWFADAYRQYGQRVAAVLKQYPRLKAFVRPFFDHLLDKAVAAMLESPRGAPRLGGQGSR